jgi:hypothetical protein
MEACLMPDFVKGFLETQKLAPDEWCKMNDAVKAATIAKHLETTKTLEEAQVVMEFWKKNYYDALHRYEATIKPFNGYPDVDRTRLLNEPLTRLRINLAEAYVTVPAYEYEAAARVLEMFQK